MNVLCSAEPCPVILNATCVHYEGGNLVYTGINTNDNLQVALEKINTTIENLIISGGGVTSVSVTAGTGIAASVANPTSTPNITITNTAPDQTVVLNAGSGISVTGTYPTFTIAATGGGGSVTAVTASAPLASSGGATPNISISQASGSTNGYLSSGDWTTFNNKVGGSGTPNYVPKWSSSSALGNSGIYETAGGFVGIGTTTPETNLHVVGNIKAGTKFYVGNTEIEDGFISGGANSFKVKTTLGNRPVFLSPQDINILSVNHDLTNGGGLLPIISVGISDDGTPESGTAFDKSVLLGLTSTTRGFVLPRMTTTQRDAITSPYLGLQVYNTTTNQINYHNGSSWVALAAGSGITSLNGETGSSQTFATGTTGTDFGIASASNVHTFNLPIASGTNTGKLSSADWTTFNNKFNLPALTAGSVLFSNGTTIAQDNANFFWDDGNNRLGIGTATPSYKLDVISTGVYARFGEASGFNNLQIGTSTSSYVDLYGGAGERKLLIGNGGTGFADIVSYNTNVIRVGNSGTLPALLTTFIPNFVFSAGTNTHTIIDLLPNINITGGTNTLRGVYYHPNNTAGSPTTEIAWENTQGDIIHGNLSGVGTRMVVAESTGKLSTQAIGNYITALTGDVTATGPGSVAATIANDAVTFAKMQNINTSKLLGRYSAGSGDIEEITISTGLSLDGSGNLTASGTSQWVTTGSDIYYTTGDVLMGSATTNSLGKLQVTGDVWVSGVIKETVTLSAQTASYTLATGDRGKLVTMSVGSANNLTVPDNATVPIPTGTKIDVIQIGTGITTILAGSGVTLLSNNSALRLNGQYAACTLIKVATDTWYVIGNLVN